MSRRNSAFLRVIALVLAVVCLCPVYAMAAEPRASYYLDSYSASVYAAGSGKIQVYFSVTGVSQMDDIGAMTVQIYESDDASEWEWVKTYSHNVYTDMLGHNKYYHSSHVDYQGTAGKYYKALVTIWAGKAGNGDSRNLWTNYKQAT